MKLIPNWKQVALRAHSMWAFYLSFAALVLPDALFATLGHDVAAPRFWWGVAAVLLAYGIWGRVKDQGIERPPHAVREPWK